MINGASRAFIGVIENQGLGVWFLQGYSRGIKCRVRALGPRFRAHARVPWFLSQLQEFGSSTTKNGYRKKPGPLRVSLGLGLTR